MRPSTIAIDGPVAAGKSVIGRLLAEHLGYRYVDTGVYYRALAWLARQHGVDPADEARLVDLAQATSIEVERPTVADGRPYTVIVDDQDVTWALRTPEVESVVSLVARHPQVREILVERQRALAKIGQVVMVGRDIGTVVLANADLKVFLHASAEERAARRYCELTARGESVRYLQILEELRRRDRIDSERAVAPLRPAVDAHVIDTDGQSIAAVLQQVEQFVAQLATNCDN